MQFESFFKEYEDNPYLNIIKGKRFRFESNINVKNLKELIRNTELNGTLQAYKLFYVGCSRAKNELVVLIENNLIDDFMEEFVNKFEEIGFVITD